jgi:choline dehydrogenase-like flavoprotein
MTETTAATAEQAVRVIVIGAGFAGLSAAHQLRIHAPESINVTVLEAGPVVGGRARAGKVGLAQGGPKVAEVPECSALTPYAMQQCTTSQCHLAVGQRAGLQGESKEASTTNCMSAGLVCSSPAARMSSSVLPGSTVCETTPCMTWLSGRGLSKMSVQTQVSSLRVESSKHAGYSR